MTPTAPLNTGVRDFMTLSRYVKDMLMTGNHRSADLSQACLGILRELLERIAYVLLT